MKYTSFRWFLRAVCSAQTCKRCNGFGGHFDGFDFQECGACDGEGEL